MGAVVLNFGGIVGAALLTTIIDKVGAFRAVAITLIPGTLLVLAMGASSSVPLPLMALVFLTGACVLGAQLSIPALAARLFPMHVRGTGIGWTMGMGRIGSIIGPIAPIKTNLQRSVPAPWIDSATLPQARCDGIQSFALLRRSGDEARNFHTRQANPHWGGSRR
jgi:MFS family permease